MFHKYKTITHPVHSVPLEEPHITHIKISDLHPDSFSQKSRHTLALYRFRSDNIKQL